MTEDKRLSFRDPLLLRFFNLICHLKQANVSVRMVWISFGALPCKKKKMTARVSMLLKSRASLTHFRACFVPGRAKDLLAPWYLQNI